MKSKYALVGVAIFCVFAVLIIYWLVGPPIFVPSNFNAPPPSPSPCVVTGFFGTSVPDTLCHDKGGPNQEGCAGNWPKAILMDGNSGTYACCPVGFDPRSIDKAITVFCHKNP